MIVLPCPEEEPFASFGYEQGAGAHEFGHSSTFVPAHLAGIRAKFVDGYRACRDYNADSSLLAIEKVQQLPFAAQFKLFYAWFEMWQGNVRMAANRSPEL